MIRLLYVHYYVICLASSEQLNILSKKARLCERTFQIHLIPNFRLPWRLFLKHLQVSIRPPALVLQRSWRESLRFCHLCTALHLPVENLWIKKSSPKPMPWPTISSNSLFAFFTDVKFNVKYHGSKHTWNWSIFRLDCYHHATGMRKSVSFQNPSYFFLQEVYQFNISLESAHQVASG